MSSFGFRFPWKFLALVVALVVANFAVRSAMRAVSPHPQVAIAVVIFTLFGSVALFVFPWFRRTVSGLVAAPFQAILWPGGRFHEPPEDLLRKLRARIRDHQGAAVEPQIENLIEAYGPSASLYELLYEALRTQGKATGGVLAEAQRRLGLSQWAKLRAAVKAIDATPVVDVEQSPIPGLLQPVVENPPQPLGPKPRLVIKKIPENDDYRDPPTR